MTARLVLLGASNVRRGLPVVVETARAAWGPNLEILGAFGHGRSYGARSRVLIRDLPGIVECGIWDALDASAVDETAAVVTDVGNDVVYGRSSETIVGWVAECVDRLASRGAAIRLTALPLVRLRRVRRADYLFFRSVFFPGSRVSLERAIETAEAVDRGIRGLAARTGAFLVEPRAHWYGIDPIHIRRPRRRDAWAEILGVPPAPTAMPLRRSLRLRAAAPDRRWIAGLPTRRVQPSLRVAGEVFVSLY